jgi:DNA-binding PadR family transcriptional regulator
MTGVDRVTKPLLDVLEVFLDAFEANHRELHGWAIMKAVARSGPTVYGVIDRLEDAGWINGRWEEQNPQPSKPRRRLYHLTPDGAIAARDLLTRRRPHSSPGVRRTVPGEAMGWLRLRLTGWSR